MVEGVSDAEVTLPSFPGSSSLPCSGFVGGAVGVRLRGLGKEGGKAENLTISLPASPCPLKNIRGLKAGEVYSVGILRTSSPRHSNSGDLERTVSPGGGTGMVKIQTRGR